MNAAKRLEELSWVDFSYVVDSLELASIAQYRWKDSITNLPDFKELAAGYEEDTAYKDIARSAEYNSCSLLCRFSTNDLPCDADDYASIVTSKMLEEGGPLSFIWNADINLEGTYLFETDKHAYFRVDLYADSSKYPMFDNHTLNEMIKSIA